jgi:hypothetical protein
MPRNDTNHMANMKKAAYEATMALEVGPYKVLYDSETGLYAMPGGGRATKETATRRFQRLITQ